MKKTITKFIFMILGVILLASSVLAAGASISPVGNGHPNDDDILTCSVAGDAGQYGYTWIINNVNPVSGKTLSASSTKAGDNVYCRAVDLSGLTKGEKTSESYIILASGVSQDTQPQISGTLVLNPAYPKDSNTLTCSYAAHNAATLYSWVKKGVGKTYFEQVSVPATQTTISASLTAAGEEWYCEVRDGSGLTKGTIQSNHVSIAADSATQPSVPSGQVVILPNNPTTSNDLTCYLEGDNGNSGFIYTWIRNGVEKLNVFPRVLDNSYTKKGETYQCIITDGTGLWHGELRSNTVTILNSCPVITPSRPIITPATAYTDTTLTCSTGTRSDADNDQLSVSIAWLKNNNVISGQISSTLSGSYFEKGDSIVCKTTVSDSECPVISSSDARIISNSAPVLAGLSDFSMKYNEVVIKDYSSFMSDKDANDVLTLSASGNSKIKVEIVGKGAKFTSPSGWRGSETITFTINDGSAQDSKTVKVTVDDNLAPTAGFTYSPSTPRIFETITFTDSSSDIEGDTLTYKWDFNNDNIVDSTAKNPTYQYTVPGTYTVKLTVTDSRGASASATKMVPVTAKLNVDSITCVNDKIQQGESQSCTIKVSAEGLKVAGATVKAFFTDSSEFGTCTTDSITGACVVQKKMSQTGTFTIYATAEKTGYISDSDSQPQATFTVLSIIPNASIQNLNTYNDNAYSAQDSDFLRGENLFVRFQVIDQNTGKSLENVITQVTLQSPPGGIANLSVEKNLNDGWYYYSLKPIPLTHDFKGESQVFTFVFRMSDNTMLQKTVIINIRNNIPQIVGTISPITVGVGNSTSVDLSSYKRDAEDKGSDLKWSVSSTNSNIASVSISGDTLTINGVAEGSAFAALTLADIDGDTASASVAITVTKSIIIPTDKITVQPIPNFTGVKQGENWKYQIIATGKDLTYTLVKGPAGMTVDPKTGLITWTPTNDQVGTHEIIIRICDSNGNCVEIKFTITVDNVNDAPDANFDFTPSNPKVNEIVSFRSLSTDIDMKYGDALTYSWNFGDAKTSTEQNPAHTYTAPGTYTVTLTVTDKSGASDSITKQVTVGAGLAIASISCIETVITGGAQSCSVNVVANGAVAGGANVKLYYDSGSLIDSCTTDSITGACNIVFTAAQPGDYIVYATAEKAGYESDLDKDPKEAFTVLPHTYDIINLRAYNDSAFSAEDNDFFRGQNMYVKFQVVDINNGNALVSNAIAEAYLSAGIGGGRADLKEIKRLNDNWYYLALEPIPLTHAFKGDSLVLTYAFKNDRSGGGFNKINVMIRNNLPAMQNIPDKTIMSIVSYEEIALAQYAADLEDADDKLTFTVDQSDSSVADLTINTDKLKIVPKKIGTTRVKVTVKDLDGDSAETSFNLIVTAAPGPVILTEEPNQHLKLEKIRLPFDESAAAGETAILTFHLKNDGDLDSEDVKITATIMDIPNARKTVGPFNLDEGDDTTVSLAIDIPKNTKEGIYAVKIVAMSEDGEVKRMKYRFLRITE